MDFKAVSEKFRVSLVHSDGQNERVVVKIGLDGLEVLSSDGGRALKTFELSHISRWQSRGSSLVLYTKTASDVEERQMTLQGDDITIRSALDTLTCCCMQLAELLQSKKTETATETANNLHALVAGGGKKKTPAALPSADEVEYWKSPDKCGFLQCQGEVLKSWRKRWFVLKQGYLFRFMSEKVTEATKPRGVVDLSKVQDIKPANTVTGRGNSLQIKTASGGSVCYLADSETEVVEWISAIEGAMARICKHVAGEAAPEAAPAAVVAPAAKSSSSSGGAAAVAAQQAAWAKQLERNFATMSTSGSSSRSGHGEGARGSPRSAKGATVNIVGYEGGGGGSSSRGGRDPYSGGSASSPYSALQQQIGTGLDYSHIAGAGAVGGSRGRADAPPALDDMSLNYGGGSFNRPGSSGGAQGGQSGYGAPQQQQQQQQSQYGQQYGQPPPQQQQQQPQQQQYGQQYGGQAPAGSSDGNAGGGYGYGSQQYGGGGGAYAPAQAAAYSAPAPYVAPQPAAYSAAPAAAPYGGYDPANAAASAAVYGGYSGYGVAVAAQPQQQQPQQQLQQAASGSLMDQVPHQQPAYPYFQHTASAPQQAQQQQQPQAQQAQQPAYQAQQSAAVAAWQAHYTAEGRPYYYNSSLGTTQWEVPAGMA